MTFSTYIMERPAVVPSAAPVGAFAAAHRPAGCSFDRHPNAASRAAAIGFGSGITGGTAPQTAQPKSRQDWANRSMGTTLHPPRHFGSTPT